MMMMMMMIVILKYSDALHNLAPFVQFKKHEEHPCRSVTFSKVAGFGAKCLLFSFIYLQLFPNFLLTIIQQDKNNRSIGKLKQQIM